ncbi:GAF and ANTAR domain-containing protein [Nonomuraea sp. NPDC048882]|uniref:GAF and ANTAR domain-containing protein n=1 Tax=Nonomuraea sp. NPDC048882 TaxID=3154347 RepID=UPI0033CF0AF1
MADRPRVSTDIEEFERALAECVAIAGRAMPGPTAPVSPLTGPTAPVSSPTAAEATIAASAMPCSPMLSVVLCSADGLRTAAASHARARLFDDLQTAVGQGPVLDTIGSGRSVTTRDLAADSRWSKFAQQAPEIRTVHCEPLESEGTLLGAFTLYSEDDGSPDATVLTATQPDATEPDSTEPNAAEPNAGGLAATMLAMRVSAAHVGVLYRTTLEAARMREVAAQLKEALTTRAIIDQALGIVMAQRRCTAQHAFELLRHVSQDRNVKLHQLAASIVEQVSGEPAQRSRFEEPPPHITSRTVREPS